MHKRARTLVNGFSAHQSQNRSVCVHTQECTRLAPNGTPAPLISVAVASTPTRARSVHRVPRRGERERERSPGNWNERDFNSKSTRAARDNTPPHFRDLMISPSRARACEIYSYRITRPSSLYRSRVMIRPKNVRTRFTFSYLHLFQTFFVKSIFPCLIKIFYL